MLSARLQSPQGGANLTEIGSHFLLDLGRVGITNQLVRSSYFLRESFQSMNVVALRSHTEDICKPTVRYKHLAAFVSARRVQYILTRVLNKLNNLIEVSDTQAVAGLIRFDAGQCSDIFWVYDSKSIENYMLDNMCSKTETNKLSVQSDEESLNETDSMKEFVVDGGEDGKLADETTLSRPQKKKAAGTAESSKETSCPSLAIQGDNTRLYISSDKPIGVCDMDETKWLEKINAAEMLACEASDKVTVKVGRAKKDKYKSGLQ